MKYLGMIAKRIKVNPKFTLSMSSQRFLIWFCRRSLAVQRLIDWRRRTNYHGVKTCFFFLFTIKIRFIFVILSLNAFLHLFLVKSIGFMLINWRVVSLRDSCRCKHLILRMSEGDKRRQMSNFKWKYLASGEIYSCFCSSHCCVLPRRS